jgi:lysophospholipase L1-like esterase
MYINLVGDSQFCRYKHFLSKGRNCYKILIKGDLTVSGITVGGVKNIIKTAPPDLEVNLPTVLFLGTNDILKGVELDHFKNRIKSLLRILRKRYRPSHLFIIALPPYPKLHYQPQTLARIDNINQFLSTLQSTVTHLIRLPINIRNAHEFFQMNYRNGRPDQIHFNNKAFHTLSEILENLLQAEH